jgi:PTS system nitrogen regulatory IIA component
LDLEKYIDKKLTCFLKANVKKEVLLELINLICENKEVPDREELKKAIFHREKLMSTGIGLGIGVPHVRIKGIKDLMVAVGIGKKDIEHYETIDETPVRIVVMIVAGEGQHKSYIKFLSLIVSKLKKNKIRENLIKAKNEKEIYNILIS